MLANETCRNYTYLLRPTQVSSMNEIETRYSVVCYLPIYLIPSLLFARGIRGASLKKSYYVWMSRVTNSTCLLPRLPGGAC